MQVWTCHWVPFNGLLIFVFRLEMYYPRRTGLGVWISCVGGVGDRADGKNKNRDWRLGKIIIQRPRQRAQLVHSSGWGWCGRPTGPRALCSFFNCAVEGTPSLIKPAGVNWGTQVKSTSGKAAAWRSVGTLIFRWCRPVFLNLAVGMDFDVCQLAILPDNSHVTQIYYTLCQIFF